MYGHRNKTRTYCRVPELFRMQATIVLGRYIGGTCCAPKIKVDDDELVGKARVSVCCLSFRWIGTAAL